MATSLPNLVDLTEGIHKTKCWDWDCFVQYQNVKDNLIKYKCLNKVSYNKDYSDKIDEELKKRFKKTFKFSNHVFKNKVF